MRGSVSTGVCGVRVPPAVATVLATAPVATVENSLPFDHRPRRLLWSHIPTRGALDGPAESVRSRPKTASHPCGPRLGASALLVAPRPASPVCLHTLDRADPNRRPPPHTLCPNSGRQPPALSAAYSPSPIVTQRALSTSSALVLVLLHGHPRDRGTRRGRGCGARAGRPLGALA